LIQEKTVLGDVTVVQERENILDRTGQDIGDPLSELEALSPDLLEVDYTNTRLKSLPPLRHLHQVEACNFRQNLLQQTSLQDLQFLTTLKSLDLYDNRLTSCNLNLNACSLLENLDLSFNMIPRLEYLGDLVNLRDLWLANNEIRRIKPTLGGCKVLRTLELGANRIKKIEHLEMLSSLHNLWLGKNRITTIENLSALTSLRKLDLQCNRITQIQGLDSLVLLQELYLSHNRITQIENLNSLTSLEILDISNNQITRLENLSSLTSLTDLWMNHNLLTHYEELSALEPLTNLTTLYLEGNPMARNGQYRLKVLLALPILQQLDATEIHRPSYAVVTDGVPHQRPGVLKPSTMDLSSF